MRTVASGRLPVASCVIALLVTCAPASSHRPPATGHAGITSLDDPKLRAMKIGVQIAAGDTPAVHALVSRHLVDNIRGYPVADGGARWIYGSSPANIYESIAKGRPNIPEFQVWELVTCVRSMANLEPQNATPVRAEEMQAKKAEE